MADKIGSKAAYPRGYFGPNVNPVTGQGFRGGKTNLMKAACGYLPGSLYSER